MPDVHESLDFTPLKKTETEFHSVEKFYLWLIDFVQQTYFYVEFDLCEHRFNLPGECLLYA